MDSKVSILIPAYNAEKNIDFCIKSVINQTYSNWELIIIDDGSEDNTLYISKKYADKDNRIKVISQQNVGVMKTRLRLLGYISGEYWTFLDADDALHPQFIEKMLCTAIESDSDIVVTEGFVNISKKLKIGMFPQKKYSKINYRELDRIKALEALAGFCNFSVALWSRLYKKALAEVFSNNLPELFVGDDICISLLLFNAAEKIVITDASLYYYRAGGGSSKYYDNLPNDIKSFYDFRNSFIESNCMDKKLLDNNLKNALHIFRGLSSGCRINGKKSYQILYPLISKLQKLDEHYLNDFFETIKNSDSVYVPKEKERIIIRVKAFILNNF